MPQTKCVACRCIESCSLDEAADAIAFGAICGLIEAVRNGASPDDLCDDHKFKLALLDSVGTFEKAKEN